GRDGHVPVLRSEPRPPHRRQEPPLGRTAKQESCWQHGRDGDRGKRDEGREFRRSSGEDMIRASRVLSIPGLIVLHYACPLPRIIAATASWLREPARRADRPANTSTGPP